MGGGDKKVGSSNSEKKGTDHAARGKEKRGEEGNCRGDGVMGSFLETNFGEKMQVLGEDQLKKGLARRGEESNGSKLKTTGGN